MGSTGTNTNILVSTGHKHPTILQSCDLNFSSWCVDFEHVEWWEKLFCKYNIWLLSLSIWNRSGLTQLASKFWLSEIKDPSLTKSLWLLLWSTSTNYIKPIVYKTQNYRFAPEGFIIYGANRSFITPSVSTLSLRNYRFLLLNCSPNYVEQENVISACFMVTGIVVFESHIYVQCRNHREAVI